MPWNEADRVKYEVIRDRYSSDMSDEEFELISQLLPSPKKRGRKPTDFRVILNAVFYMIRVGCPWRLLPKDFPPFTTVQNRFYAWRDGGLWPQIIAVLVMAAREAEGRKPAPTAVVVDSQSVKTTEAAGHAASTPARKSRAENDISPSIRQAYRSSVRSPPPTFRIATPSRRFSEPCIAKVRG